MMEGTWGFVTWQDVTSDIVQGEKATFYYMPDQPQQGWPGNAQRVEVRSFRAGRVTSARDKSARIYIEFVPRRRRKPQTGVQRSRPTLVILNGWNHPEVPSGWVNNGTGLHSARYPLFAPEWRAEMDAFLTDYLSKSPDVTVLADFRDIPGMAPEGRVEPPTPEGPGSPGHAIDVASNSSIAPPKSDWSTHPNDVDLTDILTEGGANSTLVNAYERNPEARRQCIEHYGAACFVCGFDFSRVYGNVLRGYIHVHHLKALSEIGTEYVVDPIADLRPVCPNCHAVVHSRDPQYTMAEVRSLIANVRTE